MRLIDAGIAQLKPNRHGGDPSGKACEKHCVLSWPSRSRIKIYTYRNRDPTGENSNDVSGMCPRAAKEAPGKKKTGGEYAAFRKEAIQTVSRHEPDNRMGPE